MFGLYCVNVAVAVEIVRLFYLVVGGTAEVFSIYDSLMK
jgi:hypothetical protein